VFLEAGAKVQLLLFLARKI